MAAENTVPEGAVENSCVVRVNNKSFLVGSFVWCATIVACVFMVTSNHGGDARDIAASYNLRGAEVVDVSSQSTIRALREEIESLKVQQRTLKTSSSPKSSSSSSSSKNSKKSVDTINFEETFNPTPVRLHPTTFPTASPVEEATTHTKGGTKDKQKGDNIHKTNHDSSVDSINFEETFNPTPVRLHPTTFPTAKPIEEKSKDKDFLETRAPTPKGYGEETYNPTPKAETFAPTPDNLKRKLKKSVFSPGHETFAPTPENFGKTKKPTVDKRRLKKSSSKVDTINFVETFAPTPENYPPSKKRGLKSSKVDTINFVETFAPTPENYPPSKKRSLQSSEEAEQNAKAEVERGLKNGPKVVDTVDFEETFSPTPEDYHTPPGKRDLKKNRPLQRRR
jgi:hypothetical protein